MSQFDVAQYRMNGYGILPGFLERSASDRANAFFDSLDHGAEVPSGYEPEYDQNSRLRKLRRLIWNNPALWAPMLARTGVGELARQLIGEQTAIVFHAAFLKPALVGTPVALHQDQALWSLRYPNAFSVWFALSQVSPANGGLFGCPGSHVTELEHRGRAEYAWHPCLDVQEDGLADPVQFVLQPGDAVVWDRFFAHGSAPNTSPMDRRGMVVVFADAGDPEFAAKDSFPLAELAKYEDEAQ